jgi:6-pyruvoyl-tetrahydropterin synthase
VCQNLEEYAEMLLEYKESMKEEEEWIQEMERRLICEVSDSLNNLRACQLAVQAHKVPVQWSERDGQLQQRRCSAELVLAQRRSSAAEIRTQSAKAAKKVHEKCCERLKNYLADISGEESQSQRVEGAQSSGAGAQEATPAQ